MKPRHDASTAPTPGVTVVLMISLIAVAAFSHGAHALSGTVGVSVGPTGLTGDGNDYWRVGFSAGGTILLRITPYLMAGAHASYARFGPDEETLVGDLGYAGIRWDIDGFRSVTAIMPVVRFVAPAKAESIFRPFAQIAAGLCLLRGETTITASYAGITETFTEDEISETKFGVCFGAGFDIGRFELLPRYTVVATEGASAGYYAIHAGAVFPF